MLIVGFDCEKYNGESKSVVFVNCFIFILF